MKRIAVCFLMFFLFLASSILWAEEQTDKKDSSPSSTVKSEKKADKKDFKGKKEKSNARAQELAEQYLKYSGPGFGIKKGWVAGGTIVVFPLHNYHHRSYYPTPYPYYYPYQPYFEYEYRSWANEPLKQTLEAVRLWNEISRNFPRPVEDIKVQISQPMEVEEFKKAEPEAKTTAKTIIGEIAGITRGPTTIGIVVKADGKQYEYTLSQEVIILRSSGSESGKEISSTSLLMGDPVKLLVEADTALVIRVQEKVISSRVKAIAKNTVLLDIGETFKINSATTVVLPDKTQGRPEDVKEGSTVRARLNPNREEALSVEILNYE